MQCSCPDWAVPCKHLAAVIYKVSAEIDNNPFLVFDLHCLDLIAKLSQRGIFINRESTEIPKIEALYFSKNNPKTPEYDPENAYRKLNFTSLTSIHEPLVALLSPFPVFYQGSGDFKEKYRVKLSKIVKSAQKVARGKVGIDALFSRAEKEERKLTPHDTNTVIVDKNYRSKVIIGGKPCSFTEFLGKVAQVKTNQTSNFQPSVAALHTVLYFAVHLMANGATVPQIVQLPNGSFFIRWLPAMVSKEVRALVEELIHVLPPDIFLWEEKRKQKPVNNQQAFNLLSLFLTEIMHLLYDVKKSELFLKLFFEKETYAFKAPSEEALSGGISAWLQKYYLTQSRFKPEIVVEETLSDAFEVSVYIRDSQAGPMAMTIPLHKLLSLKKYEKIRYEALQSLAQLSSFILGLDTYVNRSGKEPIVMENEDFTPFLMEMIPAIQLLDIAILLPKSLQDILKPKASLKIKRKTTNKSFIRIDQLLDFDWQIAVGDTLMDEKEFRKLMRTSEGLIKYKTQYLYVGKEDLQKLHKHFTDTKQPTAFQILRTALSEEYQGTKVALTKEVKAMIDELTQVSEIPLPKNINATLRPYQSRGFSWIYRNAKIGFGSVLADDMGLGKTLQVITVLQKYKEDGLLDKNKVLVVAPTGLLANWESEIEKFAPQLKTEIYHGSRRKLSEDKDFDVLISSYGIVRSDAKYLKKLPWQTLVIDEAQNIKNTQTAQAKAIKSIPASNFIAMSGTPVENRLSELWSIMDYSNRGFLGSSKEFNDTYANPIEGFNDTDVADTLKRVTASFLMRRVKSDKSIISDLPEKIEMDSFATLTKEQAGLYEKTLQEAMNVIEDMPTFTKKELFVRQGIILQMILALKQICNHPTQFLKNDVKEASISGKTVLLFDKLDTIVESGEKVLVFTQFTEMGNLLKHFIAERYGEAPLFYHGRCSVKQRKEMVQSFQTNRAYKIFILSLKAAGTGLNLTAANHVIHYDLWWNPAVEA